MLEKISFIEEHYGDLTKKMNDLSLIKEDRRLWEQIAKEHASLTPIFDKCSLYKKYTTELNELQELLIESDEEDMKNMLESESKYLHDLIAKTSEELQDMLISGDNNENKNVIIEIRSGAGGDEAALFASSLYRMYGMFAENNGWKMEILNLNEIELGGIKEVCFSLNGANVYGWLRFESGVHRVQRIPETEAKGRVHTSTVTVAVLPEVEEVEIEINPEDLEIDTYRASGAGGQHVNKTESAIRIKHVPTGVVVTCQSERSQHKNRNSAMKILRSRLYEMKQNEQSEKVASDRKNQVGTGDRSEKIRTYNFPQGRVTDHRIGLSLYKIDTIMNGDVKEIIDALIKNEREEKLKNISKREVET